MNSESRKKRQRRIRAKVHGTSERPRASVFRSNTQIVVQLIDDTQHKTLVIASGKAEEAGKQVAEAAKKAGIENIVFDRGGYKYHGRVKQVADTMREGGLKF